MVLIYTSILHVSRGEIDDINHQKSLIIYDSYLFTLNGRVKDTFLSKAPEQKGGEVNG